MRISCSLWMPLFLARNRVALDESEVIVAVGGQRILSRTATGSNTAAPSVGRRQVIIFFRKEKQQSCVGAHAKIAW